jgi:hypothetical protein
MKDCLHSKTERIRRLNKPASTQRQSYENPLAPQAIYQNKDSLKNSWEVFEQNRLETLERKSTLPLYKRTNTLRRSASDAMLKPMQMDAEGLRQTLREIY